MHGHRPAARAPAPARQPRRRAPGAARAGGPLRCMAHARARAFALQPKSRRGAAPARRRPRRRLAWRPPRARPARTRPCSSQARVYTLLHWNAWRWDRHLTLSARPGPAPAAPPQRRSPARALRPHPPRAAAAAPPPRAGARGGRRRAGHPGSAAAAAAATASVWCRPPRRRPAPPPINASALPDCLVIPQPGNPAIWPDLIRSDTAIYLGGSNLGATQARRRLSPWAGGLSIPSAFSSGVAQRAHCLDPAAFADTHASLRLAFPRAARREPRAARRRLPRRAGARPTPLTDTPCGARGAETRARLLLRPAAGAARRRVPARRRGARPRGSRRPRASAGRARSCPPAPPPAYPAPCVSPSRKRPRLAPANTGGRPRPPGALPRALLVQHCCCLCPSSNGTRPSCKAEVSKPAGSKPA